VLLAVHSASALYAYRRYEALEPVGFPGAARLHLPAEEVSVLRSLVDGVSSCDLLISVPPAWSFNFWSRKPPTLALASYHVLSGLNREEQKALALSLAEAKSPCVLYSRRWTEFWTSGKGVTALPWARPLMDEYRTVFEAGGYQLMRPVEHAAGK
jgi:hypothetical protein